MAANGLITSHFACKCLNIRILGQHPTPDTPPPVEAGFKAIYVGDEGIRIAHTEVTLRSRSRPTPVSGERTEELTRHTTITCLVCGLLTYRVVQRVTPDLAAEEGPLLPTDDWVEKELCKSSNGWIEVYPGCLTGEEISQAESSSMYSKRLLLVLPGSTPPTTTSQLSEDEPPAVLNVRGPSEHGKSHLPELPPLFLPPPFSPSHVVFAHFAGAASERSQRLRDEAEEYIAQVTERKVADVLQQEAVLKQEVAMLWTRFRNNLRPYEQGVAANKVNGPSRRRSVSGHTRSTSLTRTHAPSASVRVQSFVPSSSHSLRTSPSKPAESALSASLKTSAFHYPEAHSQTNGDASSSLHSVEPPSDGGRTSPARPSVTRVQLSQSSTHTVAFNVDAETSIREAHRREIDETKDIATTYRFFNIEALMEQQRLQAEQEVAASSPPVASGSSGAAQATTTTVDQGQSPRVHRSAIKQHSKSPKEDAHTEELKDGKGKRKVTFDVQPEVAIITEPVSELPTPPASSEDVIFDMDNESESAVRLEFSAKQVKSPQSSNPETTRPSTKPASSRTTRGSLPPQLSSLRPASLPAPPVQRHPISPTQDPAERSRALRESLVSPEVLRARVEFIDSPVGVSTNNIGTSPIDPREEELMKLVAASTPSHRSAWKKNSKAWQVFLSRREHKSEERDPDSIAEEANYVLDDFNPQTRRYFNGVADSDVTDEEDDSDPEHPIAQSLPIPIGPMRAFSVPQYQPKTSLSDRPGMLVPPLSTGSLRHGSFVERGARSVDPGALDFAVDSPYEDDVESDPETGGKARQRAFKILKARNELPAAGMWRSLA